MIQMQASRCAARFVILITNALLLLVAPRHFFPIQLRQTATPPINFISVTAAWNHTCALSQQGDVYCWGRNEFGQLGVATPPEGTLPTLVESLPGGMTTLAAGGQRTCALDSAGKVWCWGNNEYDALGMGMIGEISFPVGVPELEGNTTAVAVGDFHTCALLVGGKVQCWGGNMSGQLGDGSTNASIMPVLVTGFTGVEGDEKAIAIAAGAAHTCLVTTNGKVMCWGANWKGRLGDGTAQDHTTPVNVMGPDREEVFENAVAITAGSGHTCALTRGGDLWCWGRNEHGQLGIARTTSRNIPVRVSRLAGQVVAATAGMAHTCALMRSGEVWCWGRNDHGQLGIGTIRDYTTPVQVQGISDIISITAGIFHTCALARSFGLWCWGWNQHGELGDGTTIDRLSPVAVTVPQITIPRSNTPTFVTSTILPTDDIVINTPTSALRATITMTASPSPLTMAHPTPTGEVDRENSQEQAFGFGNLMILGIIGLVVSSLILSTWLLRMRKEGTK